MAIDLCGLTLQDYANILVRLLPRGLVWANGYDTADTNQYKLLSAFAAGMSQYNDNICELLAETNPCDSEMLIERWERLLGLPSKCGAAFYPSDLDGRRASVCAALLAQGGATAGYIESVLNALGFGVFTISDSLRHFQSGDYNGLPLILGDASLFLVDGLFDYVGAVCQHMIAGDPSGTALIECEEEKLSYIHCLLNKIKPAHTNYEFIMPTGA